MPDYHNLAVQKEFVIRNLVNPLLRYPVNVDTTIL